MGSCHPWGAFSLKGERGDQESATTLRQAECSLLLARNGETGQALLTAKGCSEDSAASPTAR
jgi:hypothetical protein